MKYTNTATLNRLENANASTTLHIIEMSEMKNRPDMKISIVTPTYNSAATISDTLRGILAQTYTNYEVIVVDGGSTDNTEEIVKTFKPALGNRLIWVSGEDRGLYDAMNKGIAHASGDLIGVLNSDDFYASPMVLESVVSNCKGVGAVYGDLDFVDPNDTTRIVREWRGSQYRDGAFLKGWHPAHPTFYARREYFSRLGGFDISLNVSADFELMFRFIEKNRIPSRYIPEVMVKMRMGGESTGSLKKMIEGNRNVLKAFKKNGYKVPSFYLLKRLVPKLVNVLKYHRRR